MGGKFRRKKKSTEKVVEKSRKQQRKEKRLEKKVKKNAYFQNKYKLNKVETTEQNTSKSIKLLENDKVRNKQIGARKDDSSVDKLVIKPPKILDVLVQQQKEREKESKLKLKLMKEMSARRKKQLREANREEDKVIKKLEKQLKLNKRKSKSVPKSFVDEGLDYLLEVCDSEKLQGVAKTEMNLQESGSEFEDDFAIVTGRKQVKMNEIGKEKHEKFGSNSDDESTEAENDFSDSDDEVSDQSKVPKTKKLTKKISTGKNKILRAVSKNKSKEIEDYDSDDLEEDVDMFSDEESFSEETNKTFSKNKQSKIQPTKGKQKKVNKKKVTFAKETMSHSIENTPTENTNSESDLEPTSEYSETDDEYEEETSLQNKNRKRNASNEIGKTNRNKKRKAENKPSDGKEENNDVFDEDNIDDIDENSSSDDIDEVNSDLSAEENSGFSDGENSNGFEEDGSKEKGDEMWEDIYGRTRDKKGNVVQASTGKYIPPHLRAKADSGDAKRAEELSRLHKQLKGLLNRLAENNMHSISSQIDELYMKNSRNDMNETLTALIFESLIAPTLTSERLVLEHAMLMAILHANVGMEVGAHFLQSVVKKFDEMYSAGQIVEDKSLDNVVLIISHLYNFKVFNAILMYNILEKLSNKFCEKEVELILLVLRNVGFSLRKDDPVALKDLILRLQKKANESAELRNNTRVRFMLDILLAVKNNNMSKIPQYDPSYSEHLKKLIKTMIHKGKYLTELKITLEDLLKVEERGRWWIVGSAWTGNTNPSNEQNNPTSVKTDEYSSVILELARKQRMNTDTRRNIFCILMSAEDFMDAFEKLLRLGLKAGQEQEIINVLIHCLLQEKVFNPYYAHLANQLCVTDRKHQLTIQYNVWDRLKELSDLGSTQITNLAKFLAHLFLEKSLPISVLKVVQFSDMDKPCVKLMRQLLLTTLLHDCEETMAAVFTRVSKPPKLRMFRESLRLFLHHFVLRNVKDESDEAVKLKERVKLAEAALTSVDTSKLIL